MDIDNAYLFTLQKLTSLSTAGITVTLTPAKARHDKEIVEKYSGPKNLDVTKWVFVSACYKTEKQRQQITKIEHEIFSDGISFDTGGWSQDGGKNYRDYYIDWSFGYTPWPKRLWSNLRYKSSRLRRRLVSRFA